MKLFFILLSVFISVIAIPLAVFMIVYNYYKKKKQCGPDSEGGGADLKEITLEAKVENIAAVTDFIDSELDKADCPVKARMQLDVAIDELFGNIAHYAYGPEGGTATVRYGFDEASRTAEITFIDNGKQYDPLQKADPDITLSADEREVGGLGIFLVKKTMDGMAYEYKDGKNILKITKKI